MSGNKVLFNNVDVTCVGPPALARFLTTAPGMQAGHGHRLKVGAQQQMGLNMGPEEGQSGTTSGQDVLSQTRS
jgi:hypothetical protein